MPRNAIPPCLLAAVLLVAAATGPVAGRDAAAPEAAIPPEPPSVIPGEDAGTAESRQSASISPTVVHEHRGDVATVTVRASDPASVFVGSEESGFLLRINVSSGRTTLDLNTWATDPEAFVETNVRNVSLLTGPIQQPIVPATYPVNVTVGGVERAVGALVVEERATNGSSLRVAPDGTNLDVSPSKLLARTTPLDGDPVARKDWLVFRVNASGLGGFVDHESLAPDDDAGDGRREAVAVTFVSNRSGNVGPTEFTGVDADGFVANASGDSYYVVVNTLDHGIRGDDRFTATFTIDDANPLVEETEETARTFEMAPRRVSVEKSDDELVATNRTVVNGTTTLAPGSEFEVTARATGRNPYFETRTATVTGNRTWRVEYDFSSIRPGAEFQLRLPAFEKRIPVVKATPEPETTTTTTANATTTTTANATTTASAGNETTTANASTSTANATTAATPTTNATADGDDSTTATTAGPSTVSTAPPVSLATVESGGQPGFSAGAAAVALLAAALLAARRRAGGG